MHVKHIEAGSPLHSAILAGTPANALRGAGWAEVDATGMGYVALLNRLTKLGSSGQAVSVLLTNCTEDTLKKLRRLRRKQGKSVGEVTVYTLPAPNTGVAQAGVQP